MSTESNTLVGALKEIARRIGTPLDKIAESVGGISGDQLAVYQAAISDPREELILCYTVGDLVFTHFEQKGKKVKYGLLDMTLYKLDGKRNGRYRVVWKPEAVSPNELAKRPKEYTGPWNSVVEPIAPHLPMRANSNAEYRFDGAGTIYATGPANLLVTRLTDDSHVLQISVATFITGGTGIYAGCSGVNTALGASFLPKGQSVLEIPEGEKVPGVTVSTFRVARASNIKPKG